MDRLISEKQIIDAIKAWAIPLQVSNSETIEDLWVNGVCELIKAIPSAEPKTGHWIDGGEYICFGGRQKAPCICSVCRKSALNEPWYYCPNCGARMESEGNERDSD